MQDGNLIPFEKDVVHTLSYDEKPGIQAIAATGEECPPIPNTNKNTTYQIDYEYIRLGKVTDRVSVKVSVKVGVKHYPLVKKEESN